MSKKLELYKVTKVEKVKEMLDLAVSEDGDNIAIQYRNPKNKEEIIKVTYKEFKDDTNYLINIINFAQNIKDNENAE